MLLELILDSRVLVFKKSGAKGRAERIQDKGLHSVAINE
jgi:hypothetical protein